MVLKINHQELNTIIKHNYKKKIALFVWGTFGIGKSQEIREVAIELAKERGREFIEWNKLSRAEKQKVYEYPEKYFSLVDIRLSEYDSCLSENMPINLWNGKIKRIKDVEEKDILMGYKNGKIVPTRIIKKWDRGISKEGLVKIHLENGEIIEATKQHKFLTEEGWKETKDLKNSNILLIQKCKENEKQRKEIHKRRNRFNKKELQQDESLGIGENNEEKQVGNKHNSKGLENTKKLFRGFERKGIKLKQSNRSRERLFGGNNRRGRNYLSGNTETIQQEKPTDKSIIQTEDNNKQHKQKFIGLVFGENENKSGNILPQKRKTKKNPIYNRNERIQNSSNPKNSLSISGNKKTTGKNIDEMDRKKEKIKMEGQIYRKGQETAFTNKETEFKPIKIRRIDFTDENRQIFDFTTSTGNYLVVGVVCHNSDIKGLPDFRSNNGNKEEKEFIEWRSPFFAKLLAKENSDGILLFDEINLSTPLVMSSCYKIIYDRVINDEKVSDNWLIIGAGNLDSDRAFTHTLPSPLRDRCSEIELSIPSVEDWTINFAVPKRIDSRIIGFINFKSSLYIVDFKDNQKFVTPRGWERVNKLIEGIKDYKTLELISKSAIGEGTAHQFIAFCKLSDKLNLEDLIKHPEKIEKIEALDVKYFLVTAIAEKYRDGKAKFQTIMDVSKVLDKMKNAEFVALLWRLCSSYTPNFKKDFLASKDDTFIEKYGGYII